jgi:hypothetical protein
MHDTALITQITPSVIPSASAMDWANSSLRWLKLRVLT